MPRLSSFKLRLIRISGLCGIAAPILIIALIMFAVYLSPWFSWTDNALSDLGVREAAAIFNFSLIIGGLLALVFALGLREILKEYLMGKVGTALFILDTVILCSIGVFPESAGRIHLYVSVAFFLLLPISILLIGAAAVKSTRKRLGMITIASGFLTGLIWMLPWTSPAIPEMLTALTASFWAMLFGFKMLRG